MGTKTVAPGLPDRYFALVREFPLTHIKNKDHAAQAQAVLDGLLRRNLDEGAEDYLDALTDLLGVYEAETEPIADAPARDVLRELIDASGLSQQALADSIGVAQSTISAVLNGTRTLTTNQIVKLAGHFKISSTVFLPR